MTAPRPGPDYTHRVVKAWQAYGTALEEAITDQCTSLEVQAYTRHREFLALIAGELRGAADAARQVLDSQLSAAMGDLLESQQHRAG